MGKREDIMLCYPFEKSRLDKWTPPYICQPKLDGERCRIIFKEDGDVVLLSSEKNEITSVPHINAAARKLEYPVGTELDGELYVHGWTFEEIHSVVSRTVNLHPRHEEMQFHCFDVIWGGDVSHTQIRRAALILNLKLTEPLIPVKAHIEFDFEGFMTRYKEYLSEDYEGIIVRHTDYPYMRRRSTGIMKFKPKKKDHYQIVDCIEAVSQDGVNKNMLGAFKCIGDDGTIFRVGAGCLSHSDRVKIWNERDQYTGMACEVQYQNITSNGIPRFGLCFKKPTEVWESDSSPFEALNLKR